MVICVQQVVFDLGQEFNVLYVQNVGIGVVVGFVGYVCDFNDGCEVGGMFFEYYLGMIEKVFGKIVVEVGQCWLLLCLEIFYCIGCLELGELIVFVGCVSVYWQVVFDVCNFVMDYLKICVLFWKKEDIVEGLCWVEGCCSDQVVVQCWEE